MAKNGDDDQMWLTKLIARGIKGSLFRNIATMACFAFVAGSILLTGLLVSGAQSDVQGGVDRLGPDMMAIPMDPNATSNGVFLTGEPSGLFFDSSVEEAIRETPGVVKVSSQAFVGSLNDVSWSSSPVSVIAYDPTNDFTINPLIATSYDGDIDDDEVIVGSEILGEPGSTIEIFGQIFSIAGRLEATGLSIDNSVFMTLDQAYLMSSSESGAAEGILLHPGEVSAVLVKIDRSAGVDPTLYLISVRNPGILVFPMSGLGREVSEQLSITSQGLYLTVTMVIVVSMPLIILISSMRVSERRREIGLMRAIGATKGFIFRMFFIEGVLLASMGAAVGVLGTIVALFAFDGVFSSFLPIDIVWPSLMTVLVQMVLALLAAMLLAGLAALWPAYRASKMDPYEAIRSGQN